MNRKTLLLLLLALMVSPFAILAQSLKVGGKVISGDDGLGLPGVTVQVKGTATGTITYQDENVPNSRQMSATNVPDSGQMSATEGENAQDGDKNVQENVTDIGKMSKKNVKNVHDSAKMSKIGEENVQDDTELSQTDVPELTDEELDVSLIPKEGKRAIEKKNRRRQAIIGFIAEDSQISLEAMAEKLDVHLKTIWRDITELRAMGVIDRIGEDHGGEWKILKKKK